MESLARKPSHATQDEIYRRMQIWAKMQEVSRQAMRRVTQRARMQGVAGQKWLGGSMPASTCAVTFLTHEAWKEARRQPGKRVPANAERHRLVVDGSGSIQRPSKTGAFEGYPDLNPNDVFRFKGAVTNTLLRALEAHLQK